MSGEAEEVEALAAELCRATGTKPGSFGHPSHAEHETLAHALISAGYRRDPGPPVEGRVLLDGQEYHVVRCPGCRPSVTCALCHGVGWVVGEAVRPVAAAPAAPGEEGGLVHDEECICARCWPPIRRPAVAGQPGEQEDRP